nr:hypothetical protein [Bacteroidota bacterium]
MTKKIFQLISFTATSLLLSLFYSCDYNQVDDKYSDFYEAEKNGLIEKGWIPSEIAFNSNKTPKTDYWLPITCQGKHNPLKKNKHT